MKNKPKNVAHHTVALEVAGLMAGGLCDEACNHCGYEFGPEGCDCRKSGIYTTTDKEAAKAYVW